MTESTSTTTPPSQSLRSRLIGTWELQSFKASKIDDSSNVVYPLTEDARGIIMYTPDGYMSAQLQRPPSKRASGDGQAVKKATDGISKYEEDYSGYTGEFYLDEKAGQEPVLKHHMRLSSYQDWLGNTQRRLLKFEVRDGRDWLILTPETAMKLDGEMRNFEITWRRAAFNGPP